MSQQCRITDAEELQQLRRIDGAGGEHYFTSCAHNLGCTIAMYFYAYRPFAFEHHN